MQQSEPAWSADEVLSNPESFGLCEGKGNKANHKCHQVLPKPEKQVSQYKHILIYKIVQAAYSVFLELKSVLR